MSLDQTIIVSGLPRSGTSMMMRMLEAGGIEILTDGERKANADNPNGYYELEVVKRMSENKEWLKNSSGKAVKVISQLLKALPANYHYKVIFMRRNMQEILASQKQMLIRRGQPTDRASDTELAALFHKHLEDIEKWLAQQDNFDVMYVSYNEILKNPKVYAKKIQTFLGNGVSAEKMLAVVDRDLYRQKK